MFTAPDSTLIHLSRVSFSHDPVLVWPHDVNTNTNIFYLIIDVMYDVQKIYMENEVVGRRDFRVAVDVDNHGYIHVWISDLGQAVDIHPRMCDINVQLVIPIFELMTLLSVSASETHTSCCY